MQKEKTALIIDGNWLMMSRYFMRRDSFRKELPDEVKESSAEQLADLMAQSISVMLRQFNGILTNVVLVSDSRSWRKEYPIPDCVKEAKLRTSKGSDEYKGTRTQEEAYDWKYIYKSIGILSSRLKGIGITTSNMYGVEGDDWCWWWSRKLNSEGTNVILWTSDEDIKQLIQEDEDTGAFTAWYEKSKGIILNSCMGGRRDDIVDDMDFFMAPIKPHNKLIDDIASVCRISYVNPNTIISKKIYVGDAGDNILPIFTYEKKNKTYKATQKDWTGIINIEGNGFCDDVWEGNLKKLYDKVYAVKIKGGEARITDDKSFEEHALYNKKMVWLDESQIPENIQSQMGAVEYKEIPDELLHDITYNWKTMTRVPNKEVEDLFEGEFIFQ